MKSRWLCILLLFVTSLYAQMDMPDPVDAKLVCEYKSVEPGTSFWVSVHLKIEDHWHTYWRNPGSSGLPTTIKWNLPSGVTASDIHWAMPMWIESSGLISLAYEHEVDHLVKITVAKDFKEKQLKLSAQVDWLVCTDVGEMAGCYPGEAKLELAVPVEKSQADDNAKSLFAKAQNQIPQFNDNWQVLANRQGSELQLFFTNVANPEKKYQKLVFFPHQEIFNLETAQKVTFKDGIYLLETKFRSSAPQELPEVSGVIQIDNEHFSFATGVASQKLTTKQIKDLLKQGGVKKSQSNNGFLYLFLINAMSAFLGGILLNAMPCVLPVISLKIFGFIEDAGGDKAKTWKSGLAFTAGVLVSLWVLVGILFVIRDYGLFGIKGAGWGYQLQSPTFVGLMVAGLVLFSLNLFGVFEIGTSLTTLGTGSKKKGLMSSFSTGIFTTLIATPCAAPFMATAVAFAMGQSTAIGLSIFTFLALGLSFPYLLLSFFPGWLKFVPKPGRWMESLKKFLAFPMLGAAVWLFALYIKLVSENVEHAESVAIWFLGGLTTMSLALWIYGRWGVMGSKSRGKGIASSFVLLAMSAYAMYYSANIEIDRNWIKFTPQKVEQLLEKDKPVFIDFTASWCITCQLNKKAALRLDSTMAKFKEYGVVTMTADWTKRDEVIANYLQKFGRTSVPLYLLYHGKSSEYTILPQILTPGDVQKAIEDNIQKPKK